MLIFFENWPTRCDGKYEVYEDYKMLIDIFFNIRIIIIKYIYRLNVVQW